VARRRARELVFSALFQSERGALALQEAWDEARAALLEVPEIGSEAEGAPIEAFAEGDMAFAESLVGILMERKAEIDVRLEGLIEGWSFGQMPQTDLNVLRLAVAELELAQTPPAVAIEMAVRLAKRFGGEDSGRFVNGVLAKALVPGSGEVRP
jgi:N utilization substance protein B